MKRVVFSKFHKQKEWLLPIAYEGFVIFCTMVNILYMHSQIMHIDNILKYYYHHPASLSSLFLDILFVYSLPFIMPRHKVRVVLFAVAYIISTSYILVNVLYSRYFDTYLPLNLYCEFNNIDGLSANVVYALQIKDALFVVISILALFVIWRLYWQKSYNRSLKERLTIYVGIWIATLYPTCLLFYGIEQEYKRQKFFFSEDTDVRKRADFYADMINTQDGAGLRFGLATNFIFDFYHRHTFWSHPVNLEKFKDELYSKKYNLNEKFEQYVQPNVVMIIVESLSSYLIDLTFCDDTEITPALNQYAREGFYLGAMKSQTQLGESSDGQFTYLTGLLPLHGTVTINELKKDSVVTIVNSLYSCAKRMIIPTQDGAWSQKNICKKYGFDYLFSKKDYRKRVEGWLTDKQLFEFADSMDNELIHSQPFFSVILTSSMHSPYNHLMDEADIHPLPDSLSVEMKNYLHNTHYTDKYLGQYIESLKRKGLYDNTIIVILADHKPNTMALNMKNKELCADIPMIILNSPVKIEMDSSQRINQTCVFPTILDLLNVDSEWRGVGKSLLMPDSARNSDREKRRTELEQAISEAIIWNNYSK